jgi:hypothetical protein
LKCIDCVFSLHHVLRAWVVSFLYLFFLFISVYMFSLVSYVSFTLFFISFPFSFLFYPRCITILFTIYWDLFVPLYFRKIFPQFFSLHVRDALCCSLVYIYFCSSMRNDLFLLF